jgi:hypothetical protein
VSLYEYKAAVQKRVHAEIEQLRDRLEGTSDHQKADGIRGQLHALRKITLPALDEELQKFMRGGDGEDEDDGL